MATEFKRAEDAGKARTASVPRATAAFVAKDGRLQIELSDGNALLINTCHVQGLQDASHSDLEQVEISPSGFGLHFPTVDADLYVPGLLEGRFGSARYMAAALGARGGQARTATKAASSRQNGAKGGRPRKQATV
jgi:hypothetical protein